MANLKEYYDKCWYCENFYGSNNGEAVCLTCHYFLYPDLVIEDEASNGECGHLSTTNKQLDEKLESNDSGNEDSNDLFEQQLATIQSTLELNQQRERQQQQQQQNDENYDSLLTYQANTSSSIKPLIDNAHNNNNNNSSNVNNLNSSAPNFTNLIERLMQLSVKRDDYALSQPTTNIVESIPTEVLLKIFRNLDDLSLWSASMVCKRWFNLINNETKQEDWQLYVSKRWLLYKPRIKVNCWRSVYSQLVESSNCIYCLKQINDRCHSYKQELRTSWRHRRLLLELKALQQDPPDGINAKPLDSSCYFWQAAITGPARSPYEGGIFYLYLQIPQSYPLNPPLVRFITKIFHPNINRHGDIGLDSIHENWSLALTISKVLISIQSLLTDPYTYICMDKEIGELYFKNRCLYEQIARMYTWKYAMNDFVLFNSFDKCFF